MRFGNTWTCQLRSLTILAIQVENDEHPTHQRIGRILYGGLKEICRNQILLVDDAVGVAPTVVQVKTISCETVDSDQRGPQESIYQR